MKAFIFVLILMLPSFGFAKDCIPVGTSLEEIIKSKDFASSESDSILKGISKSTNALFKLRYDNCGASPERTKEYCRSSCVLTKSIAFQDTCKRFCAIQHLILKNKELAKKVEDITSIEKSIREREDSELTQDRLKRAVEKRANQ